MGGHSSTNGNYILSFTKKGRNAKTKLEKHVSRSSVCAFLSYFQY